MANNSSSSPKVILAFVGMPGAGKTEARDYLSTKGVPFIRFGDFTEEEIKKEGLEVNTKNEKLIREKIRKEKGMGAYAVMAKPKIDDLLKKYSFVVLDGLYSWEEYTYLKKYFPFLKLIVVYAKPEIRYQRLADRPIRPVSLKDGYSRDVAELENLNKGGPIAIADFCIINNEDNFKLLYTEIEQILNNLNIKYD